MNIDKAPRISKRRQTPELLADEAWHLANNYTRGKWNLRRLQRIEFGGSILEAIGREVTLGKTEIEPVLIETLISFTAEKMHEDSSRLDGKYAMYTIASTTSQDIVKEEMPEHILEDIMTDLDTGLHMHEDDDDNDGDTVDFVELSADETLNAAEIQRNQEVIYKFDHEGTFYDYSTRFFYTVDSESVHEMEYLHSENKILWNPFKESRGTEDDQSPASLISLNDEGMPVELKDPQSALEKFVINNDFREITEFSSLDKEEHVRRALGIMAMASSSIVDLRKRRSK